MGGPLLFPGNRLNCQRTRYNMDSDIFKSAVCKIRRMRMGSVARVGSGFLKLKLRMYLDFVGLFLKCEAKINLKIVVCFIGHGFRPFPGISRSIVQHKQSSQRKATKFGLLTGIQMIPCF
jgi:hypothetical protein